MEKNPPGVQSARKILTMVANVSFVVLFLSWVNPRLKKEKVEKEEMARKQEKTNADSLEEEVKTFSCEYTSYFVAPHSDSEITTSSPYPTSNDHNSSRVSLYHYNMPIGL